MMSKVQCMLWSKDCTTEGREGEKGGSPILKNLTPVFCEIGKDAAYLQIKKF